MKQLFIMLALAGLVGCGGGTSGGSASESKVDVNLGGKASSLTPKATGGYASTKTFTSAGAQMQKATIQYVIISNYEMDTTNGSTMRKPLTSADQTRLEFGIVGAEGTDDKTPIQPGVYKVDKAGSFMNVDSVSVATFADGKQVDTRIDTRGALSKAAGQIEITSVTADAIAGKIDITEGDNSVKGSFTAKLPVKK